MQRGRSGKAHWDAWTATGLAGLAIFPLLGNVLALLTVTPRRHLQVGLLFFFALVSAYGLGRLYVHKILVRRQLGRPALLLGLVSAGLIGAFVVSAFAHGAKPTPYAWVAALMTLLWLVIVLSVVFIRRSPVDPARGTSGTASLGFNWFLCVLGGGIALTAYLMGPERPGEALMAFGGSYIQTGTSAAIFVALALVTLEGWYKWFTMLSGVYLVFISTSRAGLLIFLVLSTSILVTRVIHRKTGRGLTARFRTARDALLLLACVALVVAALFLPVINYPYLSSAGLERERVTQEMLRRYGRAMRLVPEEWTEDAARRADARWQILFDSAKVVIHAPVGYWPREFQSIARTSCGPEVCSYPHNLLLEIGFNFGWVPLTVVALGVLFWANRILGTLVGTAALSVRVAGTGFLGQLILAQVSGNLLDHSVALLLGTLWLSSQVLPRREFVAGNETPRLVPEREVS